MEDSRYKRVALSNTTAAVLMSTMNGLIVLIAGPAVLTDAFPAGQRGFALGINQVASMAGQFTGLAAGGLLAAWDWRRRAGSASRPASPGRCGPTWGSPAYPQSLPPGRPI
jgi:MFS family permease